MIDFAAGIIVGTIIGTFLSLAIIAIVRDKTKPNL